MTTIWKATGTGAAGGDVGVEVTHSALHVDDTTLDIEVWDDDDAQRAAVNIDRDEALGLYQSLGDWLVATHVEPGAQP